MFEGMLARRYITSQKRHSALTVCSIAIALALITMLFSLFSTYISCRRGIAYDEGDYHIKVSVSDGFTKEEYEAYAEAISEYADCKPEDFIFSNEPFRYWADVTFKKYIDDYADSFVKKIAEKINIDSIVYIPNSLLMECDMVDLRSALNMLTTVAIFYVFVLFLIMMLRLIIDTAFEISSKERERQLGVLRSIGATTKQIVRIITYEGLMLSAVGIPLGVGAGIGLGYLAYRAVLSTGVANYYLSPEKAAEFMRFTVNPWLLLLGVITGAVWVFLSAYGTGMRVIKMSPVQAISQRSNTVKKTGRAPLFGTLFGWTGKLASRNNLRQPKRFIASVVALTLSVSLFSAVTVVTNDLQRAAEDSFEEYTVDGDFYVSSRDEDPLIYGKQIEMFEDSGLFSEVNFTYDISGGYSDPAYNDGKRYVSRVIFYNRNAYQKEFGGNPPVSYDELSASGGYILGGTITEESDIPDRLSLDFDQEQYLSEEEYNALSDEEKEAVNGYMKVDGVTTYIYTTQFSADFDVFVSSDYIQSYSCRCILIGTFEQYKNGEYERLASRARIAGGAITCFLAHEDDYFKALDLMDNNLVGDYVYYYDNTAEIRKARAMLSSVRIGAAFLSILIALIAVVNMVNILTTGILNRRGELAAMQCVGMTEKQLYKMTAVECLQYALTSGIAAVAVCELMMFLTDRFLKMMAAIFEELEYVINYAQPLPMIGISTLCAFVIAVAASIVPLRTMRKTSLVEQIRSVDS